MASDKRYYVLRNELEHRLKSAELDGVPVEKALGDLIGLALALAVALDGPQRTETRIQQHLAHMRQSFPSVYGDGFPPVAGSA